MKISRVFAGMIAGALMGLLSISATAAPGQVPRAAAQYQRVLTANARAVWGLNAPVATFAGQLHQESHWDTTAQSPYAGGLAQFTPGTAKDVTARYGLGAAQPYNPSWALRAVVLYDKQLHDGVKVAASACDRMLFALSDYNGGPGWRMKRQAMSKSPGSYAATSALNPGISAANQAQNQDYPRRIVYRWQPLYASWGPGSCA